MVDNSELGEVREKHRLDLERLSAHLSPRIEGFGDIKQIQQFASGQSNPTYLLSTSSGKDFVLRKKPPGKLLPSAHLVEREYRIYDALSHTPVPVPKVYLLCEDVSVVGTEFFVMEYVAGNVYKDPSLPEQEAQGRREVYFEMIRVLAELHRLNVGELGLSDFGKAGNYFARQTGRWTKQYLASETEAIDSMNQLIDWLPENLPEDEETSIVHGDFQLYNMLFDENSSCVALLDWELSTHGNPLADLAYNCMKYYTADKYAVGKDVPGIPSETEMLAEYCRLTNRERIEHWSFCLAFSFFRMASIVQGVYKRGLQGNASSASALDYKEMVRRYSDIGWRIAQQG